MQISNQIDLSIIIDCHSRTPSFQRMLDSLLSGTDKFCSKDILVSDDAKNTKSFNLSEKSRDFTWKIIQKTTLRCLC